MDFWHLAINYLVRFLKGPIRFIQGILIQENFTPSVAKKLQGKTTQKRQGVSNLNIDIQLQILNELKLLRKTMENISDKKVIVSGPVDSLRESSNISMDESVVVTKIDTSNVEKSFKEIETSSEEDNQLAESTSRLRDFLKKK
jgi:hypothetical protein